MLRSYVLQYPMTPYAGVFIATVGVCVIAGAVLPNYRAHLGLDWLYARSHVVCRIRTNLKYRTSRASLLQVSFLALAIVLEIAGFRYLMPIMRPRGERATLSATLGIAGGHFLVMRTR